MAGLPVLEAIESATTTTSDTVTVNKPTGTAIGDLLVFIAVTDFNSATPMYNSGILPDSDSKWQYAYSYGGSAYDFHVGVYIREADGTEAASFALTGVHPTANPHGYVLRLSNHNGINALKGGTPSQAGSSNIVIAAATTTQDDCLILNINHHRTDVGDPVESGTGWTQVDLLANGHSSSISTYEATAAGTQSDTGSNTGTGTQSSGTWIAIEGLSATSTVPPVIEEVVETIGVGGSTDFVVDNVTTAEVGDLILILLENDWTSTVADSFDSVTSLPGAGWFYCGGGYAGALRVQLGAFGKIADSSDIVASTFTVPTGSIDISLAYTLRISGVDQDAPTSYGAHGSGTVNYTSVPPTTTVDNCLLIANHGFDGRDGVFGGGGSFTLKAQHEGAAQDSNQVYYTYGEKIGERLAAGTSPSCAATTGTSDGHGGFVIAVAPTQPAVAASSSGLSVASFVPGAGRIIEPIIG